MKNYQQFIESEIKEYIDQRLSTINESNLNMLRSTFLSTLKKIKKLNFERQKKIIGYLIASMLMIAPPVMIETMVEDESIKKEIKQIEPKLEDEITSKLDEFESKFKDVTKMRLSSEGWKSIKYEEGSVKEKGEPVLKAYKLGDGMVTIGWGHAEKIRRSKYKVGDEITRERAQELLEEDLKIAADGVRKIFKEWEEKGIDVKLTQDQFDVLVSLAFNSGVGSLRESNLIQKIKRGNLKKAGEMIKKYKLKEKFKESLSKRRSRESEKFLSVFNDTLYNPPLQNQATF